MSMPRMYEPAATCLRVYSFEIDHTKIDRCIEATLWVSSVYLLMHIIHTCMTFSIFTHMSNIQAIQ
jgi:hypothetical protein